LNQTEKSLQEEYAPNSICFGCGPANTKGLRIRSLSHGEDVLAEFKPEKHHEAFPGMINGGIIGTLLDCHCNWTAANAVRKAQGASEMPCTVTAEYSIKLKRPTPSGVPLQLRAKAVELIDNNKVWVEGELSANGKVTATCRGLFVAVEPGHPAYHRWG